MILGPEDVDRVHEIVKKALDDLQNFGVESAMLVAVLPVHSGRCVSHGYRGSFYSALGGARYWMAKAERDEWYGMGEQKEDPPI